MLLNRSSAASPPALTIKVQPCSPYNCIPSYSPLRHCLRHRPGGAWSVVPSIPGAGAHGQLHLCLETAALLLTQDPPVSCSPSFYTLFPIFFLFLNPPFHHRCISLPLPQLPSDKHLTPSYFSALIPNLLHPYAALVFLTPFLKLLLGARLWVVTDAIRNGVGISEGNTRSGEAVISLHWDP